MGGQFDLEMNFIIQEPESIVCLVELLDKCEPTCQAEIWSIFTAILKKSVRNLQACTEVGLIQQVLQRIATTDSMIAGIERLIKIKKKKAPNVSKIDFQLSFKKQQIQALHFIFFSLFLVFDFDFSFRFRLDFFKSYF